jgi:hypothetical protein
MPTLFLVLFSKPKLEQGPKRRRSFGEIKLGTYCYFRLGDFAITKRNLAGCLGFGQHQIMGGAQHFSLILIRSVSIMRWTWA